MKDVLAEIGLTDSEQKVYLALLELGDATRGPIVDKSGIAGSKVYEILERLHEKGLVSTYAQNNVRHFKATNPKQLLAYLEERKQQLTKLELQTQHILPQLLGLYEADRAEQEVELYTGLKGLRILFEEQLDERPRGECNYVIGGTQSIDEDAVVAFFRSVHIRREEQGIRTRMLFNQNQRELIERVYGGKDFPGTETRFIPHSGPVAINVYNDVTIISIYDSAITAIKIVSPRVATSFKEYFALLWETAAQ